MSLISLSFLDVYGPTSFKNNRAFTPKGIPIGQKFLEADLLSEDSMENTPQQVVGVAEQEKEDRDGQGRVDDAPLGQQALDQGRPPHRESKL